MLNKINEGNWHKTEEIIFKFKNISIVIKLNSINKHLLLTGNENHPLLK